MAMAKPTKRKLLPSLFILLLIPVLHGCANAIPYAAQAAVTVPTMVGNIWAGSKISEYINGDAEEAAARKADYNAGLTPAEADARADARAAQRQ